MVQRQQYALEESATGRDLSMKVPLYHCLRRGMVIHMSMIFQNTELLIGACPRCQTVTDAAEETNVQWYVESISIEVFSLVVAHGSGLTLGYYLP